MNILVFGWYEHGNVGDQSFKYAFQKVYPQHHFEFTDSIKEEHLTEKFDLLILGGGDIVNKDNLNKISKFKGKKIAVSVSITENSLCSELEVLEYIYVRDIKSLSLLREYGYTNCEYVCDIAINLNGDKERGKELIKEQFNKTNSEKYQKVYTIVINGHLLGTPQSPAKYKEAFYKFVNDIVEVADSTNASFLFLPFSTNAPWDDRVTNSFVNSQCKFWKKNFVMFDIPTVQDTLDIIAASDLVITTRFHGIIFSLANKVPYVTISSHSKFSFFLETINDEYIDYWDCNKKVLKEFIKNRKIFECPNKDNTYNEIHFLR